MKVLVLGRSGQLARHLADLMPESTFWGRKELDLADSASVEKAVRAHAPDFIVNAAAYTAVDEAERNPRAAWQVNVDAVATLSRLAEDLGVTFVHISTDYVFDGARPEPYSATDATNPIGVYGNSKLAGELAARSFCARHLILRTSWVFSEYGSNFVKTMLRLSAERPEISVVADQRGIPTYAGDLANVICEAIAASRDQNYGLEPGTYHVTGGRPVSWYEFASAIFDLRQRLDPDNRAPRVKPIATHEFPTLARRPANSVLAVSSEIAARLGVEFNWESSLESVLGKLVETAALT